MYALITRDNKPVLQRNGEPFLYSSYWLAELGKSYLESKHGPLKIV